MDERLERQAKNEALLREVNERIDELDRKSSSWDKSGFYEFLCECGRESACGDTVPVTLEEYERVRSQDDRFLLAPGHESEGLEVIVERTRRYLIVDKVAAAEPFVADDPRGAPAD